MEWKAIRRIYSAASCAWLVGYAAESTVNTLMRPVNVHALGGYALGAVVFALLAVAYAGAGSGGDGGGQ
jgi:hypothetical protein